MLGAIGVPPVMVGILEFANYANAKEQIRIFWKVRMLPKLNIIEGIVSGVVRLLFDDPDLHAKFDTSGVKALQQDENDRVNNNNSRIDRGTLTPNEVRAEEGRDPLQGGDIATVGLNRIPLSDASLPLDEERRNQEGDQE